MGNNDRGVNMGHLSKVVFGLSPDEASFARRKFKGAPAARERLEGVGKAFVFGYNAALADHQPDALQRRLGELEPEKQGFGYEGAAMALALMDLITPWSSRRLSLFMAGPGAGHIYMLHVGAGWAYARLRLPVERLVRRFDPVLRWLLLDGYGFHEGYFHPGSYLAGQPQPKRLSTYGRRGFDQGLGRSLWFSQASDPDRIAAVIDRFDAHRQADLWSGIGLASTYAGGVSRAELEALRRAAGPQIPHAAQGAAFAAQTRRRAGNPTPHTELACRVWCQCSAETAADVTQRTLRGLPPDGPVPAYEVWRQRIAETFGG